MFIGSPGGLEKERKRFSQLLYKYSRIHGEPVGLVFHPVGWEDTLGGVGRPQELINKDLEDCDFAIFVLHDRWGTGTGSGHSSGTEEELELAERLYSETKLRNIVLFFKKVDARRLRDPGEQLKKVLHFKEKIEREMKYLFQQFTELDGFCDALEAHLSQWLRTHNSTSSGLAASTELASQKEEAAPLSRPSPSFEYWMEEGERLLGESVSDFSGAGFCARKAQTAAVSDLQWARATNLFGRAQSRDNPTSAFQAFGEIADRFSVPKDIEENRWLARALYNKAITLGALNRSEEAIAVYEDVIARFGTAPEAALQVAKASVNKGVALGGLNRNEEEIAVYENVVARFGTAPEAALREQVANALFNKGVALGALNRSEEEIAVYEDVVARFGAAPEAELTRTVVRVKERLDQLKRAKPKATMPSSRKRKTRR